MLNPDDQEKDQEKEENDLMEEEEIPLPRQKVGVTLVNKAPLKVVIVVVVVVIVHAVK